MTMLLLDRRADTRVGNWLQAPCPQCRTQSVGIVHTINGQLDVAGFEIVCVRCGLTFLEDFLDEALNLLEQPQDVAPEQFNRGREDSLLFGKGFGPTGKTRSEQFRYAIDMANDWQWDPKRPNGTAERDRLYAMKATVGLFESKAMKSTVEMLSRKIERIQRTRNMKISEAMVDRISKLVRKGIGNAELRRPTTTRERRLIVEAILHRQELWPP
jgi:hypothetical protein